MLDRVLPPIALEGREGIARHLAGALRAYMQRFLRWLSRLIEAGGPMS